MAHPVNEELRAKAFAMREAHPDWQCWRIAEAIGSTRSCVQNWFQKAGIRKNTPIEVPAAVPSSAACMLRYLDAYLASPMGTASELLAKARAYGSSVSIGREPVSLKPFERRAGRRVGACSRKLGGRRVVRKVKG